MKFCWVTINVNNMENSLEFYKEIVGLTLIKKFKASDGIEIAFLGDGETQVELIYDSSSKKVNTGQNVSMGFEVKSLDGMADFVKSKGIDIHSGPFQPNPHIKFFYIKDPDGLNIQFVENM
ncbi:MAG: VOC family protein [Candidatus Humimicrobiaceae bacterium]